MLEEEEYAVAVITEAKRAIVLPKPPIPVRESDASILSSTSFPMAPIMANWTGISPTELHVAEHEAATRSVEELHAAHRARFREPNPQ